LLPCEKIFFDHFNLCIMKFFDLSFSTIILRYYLMMLIVIVAGFSGQWWLATLSLPVFLSCLMALKITFGTRQNTSVQRTMEGNQPTSVQTAA
ncbi:MAG: hypothetical protein R3330_03705, partial [Saprospiraceae bacterium]|nr:hypothetical protein [Saprospiraceae bacterium]